MPLLFTIETSRLRLTWNGLVSAQVGAEPLVVRTDDAVREHAVWLDEETGYSVLLQSLDGSPVVLRHRDPVVTSGLVSADQGRVVHGRIRFGSQAGRAQFDLLSGDDIDVSIAVSVLPTKLTEADVLAMRADVEAHAAGLAVAALRPASLAVGPSSVTPSVPVWLQSLETGLDALDFAMRDIERRPDLGLTRAVESVPTARIHRPSSETRRHATRVGLDAAALLARPARSTSDTPAHRWLAARLDATIRRLQVVAREEAGRQPSARRDAIAHSMALIADALVSLRSTSVLADVTGRAPAVPPLVLRRRPAYASAFDALRRLEQGMDLRGGSLDVATQDLAVVFETWAALAVVQTVAEMLGVEAPRRAFGIEARGTDIRLRRGQRHAVRLASDGTRVQIVYNPRFPAPPALLPQRPDLVLTVSRGGQTRRVVLDAKYRRDDSDAYRQRYGAAGPPEDALGTMHRYRDAIPGHVDLAAAIFPGTDDGFRTSRLWTSLETLGVGAIPIRPGHLGALADVIGGVL